MNFNNRLSIFLFLTPIFIALIYSFYFRESRGTLMNQLVNSGIIALYNGGMVSREDVRNYLQFPPEEESYILQALELTPEDVIGLGQDEKDLELLQTKRGQILLHQAIKHIALVQYLNRQPDPSARDILEIRSKEYQERLMVDAMEEDLSKVTPTVSQEELLEYYINHPAEFHQKGKRLARHMMVYAATPEAGGQPSQTGADIYDRLAAGEDFHLLIKELQTDTTTQDGNLGWLARGALHQTFDQALWALDIGEITGPIQAGGVVHFLQLMDEQSEGLIPFEQCKSQIEAIVVKTKKTMHRFKLLGLTNDSADGGESISQDEYRQALLKAAYARYWHQNLEIVKKTQSFRRYCKADLLFQEQVEATRKQRADSLESESFWVLGNETAKDLLDKMNFKLLIKLNIPLD